MLLKLNNPLLRWTVNIILILSLLSLLFMGGCYGLTKLIYVSKGCEHFYIDNTEMHTGIDIPQTTSIDCVYNKQTKLKRIYFVIDKLNVRMPRYISFSQFKPLEKSLNFKTDDFMCFNEDSLKKRIQTNALFYKEHNVIGGEYYKALLDTSTGQLWINLKYAD